MADEPEDLAKFLKDVDEVETIIKNLNSQDEEKQKEAMKASDSLLKKKGDQDDSCTKFNETVVNINNKGKKLDHQEQVLESIKSDANERAARRKKNEDEAEKLKAKGNLAFKAGRYEEAIECYTEAISLVKYFTTFYTNRAQANIKLGNYNAAIDDCKWAIRIDEKCVKAYVHCGRALQRKDCFSEAITYFKNAKQIDPKQEDVINGYIAQVEYEEQKKSFERKAVEECDSGDDRLKSVSEIVQVLKEKNAKLEEYISLVKRLQKLLEGNIDCKTLFRVTNGFDCFNEYTDFRRCVLELKWIALVICPYKGVFKQDKNKIPWFDFVNVGATNFSQLAAKVSNKQKLCGMSERWQLPEQGNFVNEMLNLAKVAVAEDEYNLEALLDHGIIVSIHNLNKTCNAETVQSDSVTLLLQITEFPLGRKRILEHADNERVPLFKHTVQCVSKMVQHTTEQRVFIVDEVSALRQQPDVIRNAMRDMQRCFVAELLQLITAGNTISKLVLGCVNNLSLEERFCLQYSVQLETIVLPIVVKFANYHHPLNLLQSTDIQLLVVTACFSTLANLARNKDARSRLQLNQQIWEASVKILTMYINETRDDDVREMVYAELGLLINILSEVSENAKDYASSISPLLHNLLVSQDSFLLQRTLGVFRLVLEYCSRTLKLACNAGTYKILLELIKQTSDVPTISYGVKCLALCSVRNATARKYVTENGLMILYKFLKSENEVTIGNSVLILGSCFEQNEACEQFIGTPIVKDMLTIATNEELSKDVKHNTAVALARLVKKDLRFLEQLRELHGLEILHSVVKSSGLQ